VIKLEILNAPAAARQFRDESDPRKDVMATINATLHSVLRHLRQRTCDSDGDLLTRFASIRDEVAFEEIVRRHGPMVLAVCRRMLGSTPDADDAFQATFLVFVRRSATIRQTDLLANWLCAVAYRTAREALRRRYRTGQRERQVNRLPELAVESSSPADWRPRFDAAFQRLPAKYREPMLLCELQGLSRSDAARQLGLKEGTLSCRLARGREMLRRRLGPGFAFGSAALVAAALPDALAAAVRPLATTDTPVPMPILQLAEGVPRIMITPRLKYALILTACVLVTSVSWQVAGTIVSATRADEAPSIAPATPLADADKSDLNRIQGTWTLSAAVHDGKMVKGDYTAYRWTITGNQIESSTASGAVQVHAKLMLDTKCDPRRIDFGAAMPDGVAVQGSQFRFAGIYRLDRVAKRETLIVCFVPIDVGIPRPTELSSERGSNMTLLTLVRPATPAEPPAPLPAPRNDPRDVVKARSDANSHVAVIEGDTPLTREEFADYLIRRYGAEKLELFVNLRIIETACARKGITVTEAEIDAAIRDDLKTMNLTEEAFRKQFLKQYNKNLVEWREDVIRPRLLLTKLGHARGEKDVGALFVQLKEAAKPKLLLDK
jgi:RNA polymerase sigma factor (sigma-70 family)